MDTPALTLERLKAVLHYDSETGQLVWLIDHKRVKAGDIAGANLSDSEGNPAYRVIVVDGRSYSAHRIAWFYMTGEWPVALIDHKDRDGLNNRWKNLRQATRSQNLQNKKRHKSNTSGFKGVSPHHGRWRARIQLEKCRIIVGTFDNPADAHAAYVAAARATFGEFARAA